MQQTKKNKEGEIQTTTNQQLSEADGHTFEATTSDSHHNHQSDTTRQRRTIDNSEQGNTTDDPDDLMTSDDDKGCDDDDDERGNRSEAETLPLEDDDTTMDVSEDDLTGDKSRRRKRKSRKKRTDDDNALLLSDRHVPKPIFANHNNDVSTTSGGHKAEEDDWSKDFERENLEEGRKGWETRCVVLLVVMVTAFLLAVIFFLFSNSSSKSEVMTDFRFANYFSDHMVLQGPPHNTIVWGYGPRPEKEEGSLFKLKGQKVVVRVHRSISPSATTTNLPLSTPIPPDEMSDLPSLGKIVATADTTVMPTVAGNTWRVSIGPLTEKGPFIVTASLIGQPSDHMISLYDVMIGDVWLCTGHSRHQNSIFKVSNLSSHRKWMGRVEEEDELRIFSVFPAKSDIPWSDIHVVDINWNVANVDNLHRIRDRRGHKSPRFPGSCWFLGVKLQRELQRPIGLVAATYSGSRLLEWAPAEVSDACGLPYSDSSSRIWNGMLHPLLEMSVAGMVWHQWGVLSSSMENMEEEGIEELSLAYECTLKGLINQWQSSSGKRTRDNNENDNNSNNNMNNDNNNDDNMNNDNNNDDNNYNKIKNNNNSSSKPRDKNSQTQDNSLHQTLPFGIIQSLPANNTEDKPKETAQVRWLGTGGFGYLPNKNLPSTFLAVTIDLPDSAESRQQMVIADRLFQGLNQLTFKNKMVVNPFPVSYEMVKGGGVRVIFNGKVKVKSSEGVEVCCTQLQNQSCRGDNNDVDHWERASVSGKGGNDVIISGYTCSRKFLGFRYAWFDAPCSFKACSLYSSTTPFSPVPPFIFISLPNFSQGKVKALSDKALVVF